MVTVWKIAPGDKAYMWPSQTLFRNRTFFDITSPEHDELRAALRKHFLKVP